MGTRAYHSASGHSPASRPLLTIAIVAFALLFVAGSRLPVGAAQEAHNDTRLMSSTYLPGPTDGADPVLVAVDHWGEPYITSSGFIGKMDAAMRRFVWKVHLPVSVRGVALDRAGALYLTGLTSSRRFPRRHAFQKRLAGQADAFVAKLSSHGKLIYASYLGARAAVGEQESRWIDGEMPTSPVPPMPVISPWFDRSSITALAGIRSSLRLLLRALV